MRKITAEIIYLLLYNKITKIRLEQLYKNLNLSPKKFTSEIKVLNSFLNTHDMPQVKIGSGYLRVPDELDLSEAYQLVLELSPYDYSLNPDERRTLLLINLLITEDVLTMDHFADLFYVSRLTIIRDINTLKKQEVIMSKYIETLRGEGVILKMNQSEKREYLFTLFLENIDAKGYINYVGMQILRTFDGSMEYLDFLGFIFNELKYAEKYQQFDLFVYIFIVINMPRKEQGESPKFVVMSENLSILIDQIEKRFDRTISFEDKQAIAEYCHLKKRKNAKDAELYNLVIYFLNKIDEDLGTTLKYEFDLISDLYNHLQIIEEENIILDIENIGLLRHQFMDIIVAVRANSGVIENYLSRSFNESFITTIAIHIATALTRQEYKMSKIDIWIVCENLSIAKMIAMKISRYKQFKIMNVLTFGTYRKMCFRQKANRLILTADSLPFLEEDVLRITPFVTQEDIQKIVKMVDRLFTINEEETEEKFVQFVQQPQRRLHDYLLNSHVIRIDQKCSWERSLRLAGEVLTQNECIEQSYVEEVVENVKQNGPYIVISEGVDLAHANNRGNVHRSTISLLTNKQKISYGSEDYFQVTYVFFVALVRSEEYLEIVEDIMFLGKYGLIEKYLRFRQEEADGLFRRTEIHM